MVALSPEDLRPGCWHGSERIRSNMPVMPNRLYPFPQAKAGISLGEGRKHGVGHTIAVARSRNLGLDLPAEESDSNSAEGTVSRLGLEKRGASKRDIYGCKNGWP